MQVQKRHQLTDEEFLGCRGTKLYETLVSNKYVVVCTASEDDKLFDKLSDTVTQPWYLSRAQAGPDAAAWWCYVSCNEGIRVLNEYAKLSIVEEPAS